MIDPDRLSALNAASQARLLLTLSHRVDGETLIETVIASDSTSTLDADPLEFIRLSDGEPREVQRAEIDTLDIETLVYDMAHLMIEAASTRVGLFNQEFAQRRKPRLTKQQQVDIALRITQLYLVMLEVRLSLELPGEVVPWAVQHHKLAVPEILLAHQPDDEMMNEEEQLAFLDRFHDEHNALVDAIDNYQRGFRGRPGDDRDVFWFFARQVIALAPDDESWLDAAATALKEGLQSLDFDGYLKELTTPAIAEDTSGSVQPTA